MYFLFPSNNAQLLSGIPFLLAKFLKYLLVELLIGLLIGMLQVVEITKGSKVKYELDKKTGLIKV